MALLERLNGRVALVTGASKGIGRAIAQRLASLGADIVVSASGRDPAASAETVRLVEALGRRAVIVDASLEDEEARATLVPRAADALGPIDILVNNAAAAVFAPPSKIDLPARQRIFEIDFHAPLDLIQAALPGMRMRGFGRILNISSGTATASARPLTGNVKFVHALVAYGAAKAALDRITTGLAAELFGTGIQVNAVRPCRIAASEGAMALAKATLPDKPDWVEGVDMMAEAAAILVASPLTGIVASSREVLAMTLSPLHSLDGQRVTGDALTIPDLG